MEMIEWLLVRDPLAAASGLILGVLVGGGIVFKWLANHWANKITGLEAKLEERQQQLDNRHVDVSDRDGTIARHEDTEAQLTDEIERLTAKNNDLSLLPQRIRRATAVDGRVWEFEDNRHDTVEFFPVQGQRFRVISVANLKGGVGKSTIAANLASSLRTQGNAVLLVDLDFQGTLSVICLPPSQRNDLRDNGRLAQRLFRPEPLADSTDSTAVQTFNRLLTPIRGDNDFNILATSEDELIDYETSLLLRWLLQETPDDIRFRLRSILHSEAIRDRYDYIILDCPPRLTTASVNALASSHFVIIPAILDDASIEACPNFLSSIDTFKQLGVCDEHLSILGIAVNKTDKANLSEAEDERQGRLTQLCADVWSGDAPQPFSMNLFYSVHFGQALEHNEFVHSHNATLRDRFDAMANDVMQRVAAYASR